MNRRHYSHCGERFSFLKSGSKPSERHSFTSAMRLGTRPAELFVGGFDLLVPCCVPSKDFRSCESCQRREPMREAVDSLPSALTGSTAATSSTAGTYATSTLSTRLTWPDEVQEAGGLLCCQRLSGIRPRPVAAAVVSFGLRLTHPIRSNKPFQARWSESLGTLLRGESQASASNRSGMRQFYLVG
jgi:hypothetical protein